MSYLTLEMLLNYEDMIDDKTKIIVCKSCSREDDYLAITSGNRFDEDILKFKNETIKSLSYWADQNRLHIFLYLK